jgi:hypothetical protein
MPDTKEVLRAVTALEQVQAELAAISARTDERRRHDLIDLRRKLSLHIAEVGRIAEPHFAKADPEVLQSYRTKFSRMRSAAAMHQANWPAVRLDQADADYQQSVLAVRDANREFVAWVRQTLR